MNDEIVDLTHSLQSGNSGNEHPPQDIVIQTLGKFDVNFEEFKKEVNILNFQILQSREKDRNSIFEEYESVSYKILLVTYNVEFLIRILSFQNDFQYQILKLDIQPKTTSIKKEIEYCCNSLQRRRNLHLMFKTLITFGRFIESRRLISDLILKKNGNITIEQNKDGGIIIVYSDQKRNVRLGIFWSIACSSNQEVTDIIEVYYKVVELPNEINIKHKLNMLTEPSLNFTEKYHLWKSLIDDLSGRTLFVKINKIPYNSAIRKYPQTITILSDSEDSSKGSLVAKVDKISSPSAIKTVSLSSYDIKKGREVAIISDSGESARRLRVNIEKMTVNSRTREVLSKWREDNQNVILNMKEFARRSLVVNVDKIPVTSLTKNGSSDSDSTGDLLSYLRLEKVSSKKKLGRKGRAFAMKKPLTRLNRQFTKHKEDELESASSSDSEIREKHKIKTSTHSSDLDMRLLDSDEQKTSHSEYSSSDSSNDEFRPSSYMRDFKTKKIPVQKKRQKKKNIPLGAFRKSPRFSNIYSAQEMCPPISRKSSRINSLYNTERDLSLSPKATSLTTPERSLSSESSNSAAKQTLIRNVPTSTVTSNKGLLLVSDSSLLSSLLPNNLLNASTSQGNVRIRLVPDGPVSSSPSFVELNLISSSQKPKIIDDDLEITSVTYIVPD